MGQTAKNGITSVNLAAAMQRTALGSTGFPNRGLVNRSDLLVLNGTKMPACLIEYGFVSNPLEAKLMHANTSRYGRDLYVGIVEYMKSKGRIQ
jgi:N-acetylmuramoyl-L-alanine amidase